MEKHCLPENMHHIYEHKLQKDCYHYTKVIVAFTYSSRAHIFSCRNKKRIISMSPEKGSKRVGKQKICIA
jgi:hypothetical protein